MVTRPENSRLFVTFRLRDRFNVAGIPTTLQYRIRCDTTGNVLLEWTSVSPAAQVQITVPASLNKIINRANTFEIKTITVEADSDTDNAYTDDYSWRVRNLTGVT